MVSTSPVAKASKARRTRSSLGWAMTPPFPRTGSGSLRLRHPTLNDPPVPVAPYLARPGLDDAHSSLFGLAGPGALADVAADPLGVVRPAGEQFGIRALDFLRVGGRRHPAGRHGRRRPAGRWDRPGGPPRGPRPAAAQLVEVGDSNSGRPSEGVPGRGYAGVLTCGSLAPVVTFRARCIPPPTGSACIHCVHAAGPP